MPLTYNKHNNNCFFAVVYTHSSIQFNFGWNSQTIYFKTTDDKDIGFLIDVMCIFHPQFITAWVHQATTSTNCSLNWPEDYNPFTLD